MNVIDILDTLEELQTKILSDDFVKRVSEKEMLALVEARDTIKHQKAQIEKLEMIEHYAGEVIKNQEAEIERYKGVIKLLERDVQTSKSDAIKEFAERLCEDRITNDPVVIAVKTELKMMMKGGAER